PPCPHHAPTRPYSDLALAMSDASRTSARTSHLRIDVSLPFRAASLEGADGKAKLVQMDGLAHRLSRHNSGIGVCGERAARRLIGDRKSTRLNSSHGSS